MHYEKVTLERISSKERCKNFCTFLCGQLTVQAVAVQQCGVLLTKLSTPPLKSITIKHHFSLAEHILHIVIQEALKTGLKKQNKTPSISWWSWNESYSWVWKPASDLTPSTISDELRSSRKLFL